MKKLSILTVIIYCSLLLLISGYKVINPENTYFNYKKVIVKGKKDYEKYIADNKNKADEAVSSKNDTSAETAANTSNQSASIQNTAPAVNVTEETYDTVTLSGTIGSGSKGDMVKKVQYLLKKKGYYNGEITGNYTQDIITAVKKFQKDNKLTIDGFCGPATCNLLIK